MRKVLYAAILLLAIYSCTTIEKDLDVFSRDGRIKSFHATTEQNAQATKVYADENLRILWNAGDQLTVFNQSTYNSKYEFKGNNGDNAGDFTDVTSSGLHSGNSLSHIYAVYPYNSANKISNDGGTITLTLPSTQQYKEHSFGIGANTMVAVTDNKFLAFKNLGGFLQLRLYGDDISVSSISIKGNKGEKIAGNATVAVKLGTLPNVTMTATATNEVSIVCNPAVKLGATAENFTDFWFVLPPVTFKEGFTITVTDVKGGVYQKATAQSMTISRSTVEWMSALKVTPVYENDDEVLPDVNQGIAEMYEHLKYMYGSGVMINHQEAGTDEFTWAESAEGSHKIADMNQGDTQWSASNNPCASLWRYAFQNINTANGVIENGETNGAAPSLLAEARFFRAFDYFLLVQTFGGLPLDLGSGELKYSTATRTTAARNTVDQVYDRCIIPDLEYAIANLPDTPRKLGAVTKTVARLYLAKAYLTYAWWNENPKGIDTYPPTNGRSAYKARNYFQKAYNTAMEGINLAPNTYGLEFTYYDLWVGSNLYSKEALLFADYNTWDNYKPGGLTGYQGGDGQNMAFWMINPNYTYLKASTNGMPAVVSGGIEQFTGGSSAAMTRAAEQGYGRPWARMAPVQGVFYNIFNDLRDSRLDVTFNMTYKQNQTRFNGTQIYGAMGKVVEADGAILKFIPNQPQGVVSYPSDRGAKAVGANGFAAGTMYGENAYVIEYSHIGRTNFPGPWKHSIWLTTNSTANGILKTDTTPGQANIGNPTPNVIARFAEFYFVAAEANIKGATPSNGATAYSLIKVIRERAGRWTHSVAEGTALVAKGVLRDYSADLVATIPATITIDWLLDEYSREFFAEYRRWHDLVRTQSWVERASQYQMGDRFNDGPTNGKTWTRNIRNYNYLRPIPISQINSLDMTDAQKAAYQNPGYTN